MSNISRSAITEVLSEKQKIWMLVVTGFLFAADLTVAICLAVQGVFGAYLTIAAIFAAVEALFFCMTLASNQRFKYASRYSALFAIADAVLLAVWAAIVLGSEGKVFTTFAWAAWLVFHACGIIATAVTYLYASHRMGGGRATRIAITSAVTAIMCVCAALYGVAVIDRGYFGQGERPLVYERAEDGSYIVTGVMDGNGDTVIIPESFDGKAVSAVSATVFAAKGVKRIELDCAGSVAFTDADKLTAVSDKMELCAPRKNVDAFRSKLYALDASDEVKLSLGNSVKPSDLKSDEVCVTFSYDSKSFSQAEGNVISTWYGKKGDVITLDDLGGVDYAERTDIRSDEDLYWCYNNLDGLIMSAPEISAGELIGTPVNRSVYAVPVTFERIYKVYPGASNDDKHATSLDFDFSEHGGSALGYKLTVASIADEILAPFEREGFSLEWLANSGTFASPFTSLTAKLNGIAGDSITISPQWTLNAPEVTILAAHGTSITYGDPFALSASVSHALADVVYAYTWTKDGNTVGSASGYSVNVMPFDGGGEYGLLVEASAPQITSLKATVTRSSRVSVGKRAVTAEWVDPQNTVYDGAQKTVTVSLKNAVAGDDVSLKTTSYEYTNAGTYSETAVLTGDTAERYTLVGASHGFTVDPMGVEVIWSNTSLVYNGSAQIPDASATGVSGALSLNVTGSYINAGSYTARASIADTNYNITRGASTQFTIDRYGVTVVWANDSTRFVYDGERHAPSATATGVNGAALTVAVSGGQINANTEAEEKYTATASISNTNYRIDEGATCAFTIEKKTVSVVWGSVDFVYNGNAQAPTATATGVNDATLSLNVSGARQNAGENYTATAALRTADSRNYEIAGGNTTAFSIAKMGVSAVWGTTTHEYDGTEWAPAATAVGAGGATLTLTVSGKMINAGSNYTATASLSSADSVNYKIDGDNTETFAITPTAAAVSWGTTSHEYDGNEWAPTATATGVEGENIALTVTGVQANVGSNYTATASTANGNYTLTGATTPFVITAKAVEVSWGTTSHEYDGNEWAPTATATGVKGEIIALTVTGGKTHVGSSYTATASTTNKNYTLTGATTPFAVTPKAITVKLGNVDIVYGDSLPEFTYTVTGTVNGESVTVRCSTDAEADNEGIIPVGSYKITATVEGASDYTVTVTDGTLTVSAREEDRNVL